MSEAERMELDMERELEEIENEQRYNAITHAAVGDYQSMFEPIDVEEVVTSSKEERGGPPIKLPPGGPIGFHYADGVGVVGALHPQTPTSKKGQKLLNELQGILEEALHNFHGTRDHSRALDILHELSELLRGEQP